MQSQAFTASLEALKPTPSAVLRAAASVTAQSVMEVLKEEMDGMCVPFSLDCLIAVARARSDYVRVNVQVRL